MRVLVVNAGSSSLKLSLIGDRGGDAGSPGAGRGDRVTQSPKEDHPGARHNPQVEAKTIPFAGETVDPIAERQITVEGEHIPEDELREALEGPFSGADAVGHRIVHGGERFLGPARIDAEVEGALRELSDLAPLHQAKSLAALDAVSAMLDGPPEVACFDTAFHSGMPEAASTYALPLRWRERWAVRRYGFHGLSHAWVAARVPKLLGATPLQEETSSRGQPSLRIVSCHLGAGASLCAIEEGRSIDTTMGFTPLEGLAMATRSGSVDPGLLLWLMEHTGLSEQDLAHALEHESGLLGLAGTADMRKVLSGAQAGERRARLALDVYIHRLGAGVAAMAASLGGIDVLAFTGGVGERSPQIRQLAADRLRFLGVEIDGQANERGGEGDLSAPGAATRTVVLEAREDLTIAGEVRDLLRG